MKTRSKIIVIISVSLNLVLIVFCVLLANKAGYFRKAVPEQAAAPSQSNSSGNEAISDNPQFDMRESLFNIMPDTESDIIFLGDSITQRCEWSELLPDYNVKNRGIDSDTTTGVLKRIDEIINMNPQKIFLLIGINDIGKGKTTDEISTNYNEILSEIKTKIPDTEVYAQSVLPINEEGTVVKNDQIVDLNSSISAMAEEYGYTYVDLYSLMIDSDNEMKSVYTGDGTHLTGDAYLVWEEAIEQYLG